MSEKVEFVEPIGSEPGGYRSVTRRPSAYEKYMEEEGLPIHRGIGVYDCRQLRLGPWKRLGGRACFVCFDNLENAGKGMYLVEVPAGGVLNAERHIFDEFFLVIEGSGSAEVWLERGARKHVFQWQAGSLFTVPLNAWHRLVCDRTGPALVLSANNAPPVMNIFMSRSFVFENPYDASLRFDEREDFYTPRNQVEADRFQGRASIHSNLFPDIVNCGLPLDNQRAPGYRRFAPHFSGFPSASGFIAEYPSGRYSKAHFHAGSAVLVCLRGKGYSFSWPIEIGPRPWEDGKGHLVKMQEYIPGGMVMAAPGGGNRFHQHFAIGRDPLRVINFSGGPVGRGTQRDGEAGDENKPGNVFGIGEGGRTIHYHEEDPYVREYYRQRLHQEGVAFQMPDEVYRSSRQ